MTEELTSVHPEVHAGIEFLPSSPNLFSRLIARLIDFICFGHTDLLELMISAGSTLWGFWVANPFSNAFDSSLVYQRLEAVMPENYWGLVMLSIGMCKLYGIASQSYRWRKFFSLAAFLVWLFMTILCLRADAKAPIIAFFLLFSIASALVYIRIGRRYLSRH